MDNGAIYSSHHFSRVCGRLRTELKHTKPGRPQGRGKQEKFFRFVDLSFVPEAYDLIDQGKIQTLAELNQFFTAWLDVAYHQKVHNSFKQRPTDRYHKCEQPIRRIPPHELMEVFLMEETRKVDKTNCCSLLGTLFEVESGMAGEAIQLRFDPYDMSVVQVWKEGVRGKDARKLEKHSLHRPKTRETSAFESSMPTPTKTGLNYVELAHEAYMEQQRQKAGQGLHQLMKEGIPL